MGRKAIKTKATTNHKKEISASVTCGDFFFILKSASNLNGNLNCSKELEHYAS